MIRAVLSSPLRALAQVHGELSLEVVGEPTQRRVLDAIETRYPMLRGTLREHGRSSVAPKCDSLPATARSRISRQTHRCPLEQQTGPSRCWSLG